MSFRLKLALLLFLLNHLNYAEAGNNLISGKPIPVGSAEGLGPLANDAVVNIPIGTGLIYSSTHKDLFVATGRFGKETGLL